MRIRMQCVSLLETTQGIVHAHVGAPRNGTDKRMIKGRTEAE